MKNIKDIVPGIMIALNGPVDDSMLKTLDEGLVKLFDDEKWNKTGAILLTTHGGSISSGEAIAERIEIASQMGADLRIIGATFVESAGVRILLSLPQERRFVSPKCVIMIHPAKSTFGKYESRMSFDELEERLLEEMAHLKHYKSLEEAMIRRLIEVTGIKRKQLLELYRTSHRFDARDAVRYNLASAIIG